MLGKVLVWLALGVAATLVVMSTASRVVGSHWSSFVDGVHPDVPLVEVMNGGTWAPVRHGRPVPREAIRFDGDEVRSVRCHAVLGRYTVTGAGAFTFRASPTPVPRRCAGPDLRRRLTHTTTVVHDSDGLALSNASGHEVLTLADTDH